MDAGGVSTVSNSCRRLISLRWFGLIAEQMQFITLRFSHPRCLLIVYCFVLVFVFGNMLVNVVKLIGIFFYILSTTLFPMLYKGVVRNLGVFSFNICFYLMIYCRFLWYVWSFRCHLKKKVNFRGVWWVSRTERVKLIFRSSEGKPC